MKSPNRYFVIYKPFGYLSQFTKEIPTHNTLSDLYDFPEHVYPVGRLDKDSEGLLILTNDRTLNNRLLNPQHRHPRLYYAQVEGIVNTEHLQLLEAGPSIKLNKRHYKTKPCCATLANDITWIQERNPPIRFRQNIPTTWITLELIEGKNRQVRKMCAAVGIPVLRLIRSQIGQVDIRQYNIGEVREIMKENLFSGLFA